MTTQQLTTPAATHCDKCQGPCVFGKPQPATALPSWAQWTQWGKYFGAAYNVAPGDTVTFKVPDGQSTTWTWGVSPAEPVAVATTPETEDEPESEDEDGDEDWDEDQDELEPVYVRNGRFAFDANGWARPVHQVDEVTEIPTGDTDRRMLIGALAGAFGGRIVGRGRSAMSYGAKREWLVAWFAGDMAACYAIESAVANPDNRHPGHPDNPATHFIVWAPAVAGETPAGAWVEGSWSSPANGWVNAQEVRNYLVKAGCRYPRWLTTASRRTWVRAHLQGDKLTVDRLSLLAKTAHDSGAPPVLDKPSYDPAYAVAGGAAGWSDFVEVAAPPATWPTGPLRAYHAAHQLPPAYRWADLVAAVTNHLAAAQVQAAAAAALPVFTVAAEQPQLPGANRKTLLQDQHGRRWLFKPAPSPDAAFRPEAEHQAHQLARLWGFRTAASLLTTIEGVYGQAQLWHEAAYNLSCWHDGDFAKLTVAQLCALAREHLLDWALDNDDSHGDNLVVRLDGTLVGIDKGRAWRYFGGWPGLASDAKANTNAPLIYTELYAAIAAHVLDRTVVDAMYRDVIATATRMQRLPDDTLAAIIAAAVANRPHYAPSSYQTPVPNAPTCAAELIAAATERKNNLAADMRTLWGRIYARAGWQLPEDTTPLGNNPQGHPLHTGLHSPDLHNTIALTKSYGTATFVAGEDIEDAHILLWRERRPDHHYLIRGHAKVRGAALARLQTWCRDRLAKPAPAPKLLILPREPECYIMIIEAAKTISYHAEDKEYNKDKVAGLAMARRILRAELDILQGAVADPIIEARQVMCRTYLDYIDRIDNVRQSGGRTQEGDFPRFCYTPPPPAAVPVDPQAPTVELVPAARAAAHQNDTVRLDPDGELALNGTMLDNSFERHGHAGQMYRITLKSGEVIELRGSAETSTPIALWGQLQFTVPADGIAAGLQAVEHTLQSMGLSITAADHTDLELFYWRHLYGIFRDRVHHYGAVSTAAVHQGAQAARNATTREAERDRWRAAFAHLTSPEQISGFLAADGHLPRFSHLDLRNPDQPCGKPYWERFDVTAAMWSKKQLPSVCYRTGVERILASGACLSTEARIRTLAIWKSGMSSADDMVHGSSAYVFCRQNREHHDEPSIYFSPRVLARTHNYAFDTDRYGRINERSGRAPFDFDKMTGFDDSANELMVKDALSVLDDVEILAFDSVKARAKALEVFASHGIATIRGIDVSTRCILRGDYAAKTAAIAAVRRGYHPAG